MAGPWQNRKGQQEASVRNPMDLAWSQVSLGERAPPNSQMKATGYYREVPSTAVVTQYPVDGGRPRLLRCPQPFIPVSSVDQQARSLGKGNGSRQQPSPRWQMEGGTRFHRRLGAEVGE